MLLTLFQMMLKMCIYATQKILMHFILGSASSNGTIAKCKGCKHPMVAKTSGLSNANTMMVGGSLKTKAYTIIKYLMV